MCDKDASPADVKINQMPTNLTFNQAMSLNTRKGVCSSCGKCRECGSYKPTSYSWRSNEYPIPTFYHYATGGSTNG